MTPKEFVDRLTELALDRDVDAGPFTGYGNSEGHHLEIYEHRGDQLHPIAGVYIWDAGCSNPNRVEPEAFDNALAHVNALPMNLEDFADPVDGDEWPGGSTFIWRAVLRGCAALLETTDLRAKDGVAR